MPKRISPFRLKGHIYYTVKQAAEAMRSRPNTIHGWIQRQGLQTVDAHLPYIIKGATLIAFLKRHNRKNCRRCEPTQFYCLACKQPRGLAFGEAELLRRFRSGGGFLRGLCSACGCLMHQAKSADKLSSFARLIHVSISAGLQYQNDAEARVLNPAGAGAQR
jgi:hypothetical protein